MNLYRSGFVVLLATVLLMLSFSPASSAQVAVGISVRIGPPALPVYVQPLCPGPGYFWTPGYWAWSDDDGYYWVPGTWVIAPVGMLWTPGYWAFSDGFYGWHAGYWGPHVGFYGGINYGFGYGGVGFWGGRWGGGGGVDNTAGDQREHDRNSQYLRRSDCHQQHDRREQPYQLQRPRWRDGPTHAGRAVGCA